MKSKWSCLTVHYGCSNSSSTNMSSSPAKVPSRQSRMLSVSPRLRQWIHLDSAFHCWTLSIIAAEKQRYTCFPYTFEHSQLSCFAVIKYASQIPLSLRQPNVFIPRKNLINHAINPSSRSFRGLASHDVIAVANSQLHCRTHVVSSSKFTYYKFQYSVMTLTSEMTRACFITDKEWESWEPCTHCLSPLGNVYLGNLSWLQLKIWTVYQCWSMIGTADCYSYNSLPCCQIHDQHCRLF